MNNIIMNNIYNFYMKNINKNKNCKLRVNIFNANYFSKIQ